MHKERTFPLSRGDELSIWLYRRINSFKDRLLAFNSPFKDADNTCLASRDQDFKKHA